MTHEHKQQCNQIFSYYGEDHQLEKFKEELLECVEAVTAYQENKTEENRTHLAEECADVRITQRQMRNVVGDKIDEFVHFKLERQLKRIAAEQKPPVCSYTGLECSFCQLGDCEARR